MSLYVEWLNKIKAKATSEWLTDAQRKAFDQIINKWSNQPFICLLGLGGSGKTFVAHILAREHGYLYANEISEVDAGKRNVMIDGEEYTRLMRDTARINGIQRVILISRTSPKDRMPKAEIELSDQDIRQFQHNLVKYGVLGSFLRDPETKNLSEIIRNECIARVEKNVNQ